MPFIMPKTVKRQEKLAQELDRIRDIIKNTDILQAYVFGSFAAGDIHTTSDLDILIIKETKLPFLQRLEEIYCLFEPKLAMDIIVYTPEELADMREKNFFVSRIIKEGSLIYEAGL